MKLLRFDGVHGDVYINPEKVTNVREMRNSDDTCFIEFDNENTVKVIQPLEDVVRALQSSE